MAKISPRGLIVIALVLSLTTAFLVYGYLHNLTTRANKEGVPVVVAKVDIPVKTRITKEMVEETMIPADYVQPGAMTELSQVVGVVVREPIIASEQITQRRLLLEGKSVGFTGIIPRDRRALTVAVSDVTGVSGFVKAGDYVDVIVTFEQSSVGANTSKMILQNLQVLAANRDSEAGVAEPAKDKKDIMKTSTVTLAVTPEEAVQLTLGEEKGKVRLALRPYLPSDGLIATNAYTPRDLVGAHESPVQNGGGGGGGAPSSAPAAASPPPASYDGGGSGIQVIRGTKVSEY